MIHPSALPPLISLDGQRVGAALMKTIIAPG
jgi:hypothetical protein